MRLDLASLANRSVGVFGASGTGKTFLARMLLAGLVKQTPAVSLVFDMESEYGWQGQDNDRGRQVKGLKQLFPSRVVTFTLDEASSRRRGVMPDGVVRIGYDEVEPADIEVLRDSAQPVGGRCLDLMERRPAFQGELAPGIHPAQRC